MFVLSLKRVFIRCLKCKGLNTCARLLYSLGRYKKMCVHINFLFLNVLTVSGFVLENSDCSFFVAIIDSLREKLVSYKMPLFGWILRSIEMHWLNGCKGSLTWSDQTPTSKTHKPCTSLFGSAHFPLSLQMRKGKSSQNLAEVHKGKGGLNLGMPGPNRFFDLSGVGFP